MINITSTQLRKAADIKEQIQSLQKELGQLLGGSAAVETTAPEAPKKRKFSAATKAKMRKAQKARWAKINAPAPSAKPAQKPRTKISAAGLANIRAAQMARWAEIKTGARPVKKHHITAAAKARLSALAKARWAKVKKAGKSRL